MHVFLGVLLCKSDFLPIHLRNEIQEFPLMHMWNSYFENICSSCANVLSRSVVSNSLRPHGLKPTRLLCAWDFPARILEWVAISYFRGSSQPRNRNLISCVSCFGRWILYHCTTWKFPGHLFYINLQLSRENNGILADKMEKAMAPHSSTLAWKIPWMEEPGRLQSMGSLGVGYNWATSLSLFTFMHWRRKWQPTPVFLPGESQGQRSLVGCCLWGRTESDMTEAT